MRRPWRTATAVLLALWAAASLVLVLGAVSGSPDMRAEGLTALVACAPAAVLGGLLALRRPDAPGVTALVSLGTFSAVAEAVTVWGLSADSADPWPAAALFSYLAVGIWVLHLGGFVVLCLVFPDGLLPGRLWRVIGLGYVVLAAVVIATLPPLGDAQSGLAVVVQLLQAVGLVAVVSCSVAALVVRYRRGDEVTRDQLRWLALGAGTVVVLWVAGLVAQTLGVSVAWSYTPCILALLLLLPATVAIAVVRHDLFDVERLLTDSVTWVLTTVAAAAFFALVVTIVTRAAEGVGATASVAVAAFVTAITVGPLHGVLRDVVGRFLDRDRTVRLQQVRQFVRQVRDGERPPSDLQPLLRELLSDPEAYLVLHVPDQGPVTFDGEPVPAPPGIELRSAGTVLATLVLSRPTLRRQRIARILLTEASLPLELARSQVQLRAALSAVEDSRARILTAEVEERRRLERDLHDGTQQRLVAVGMRLRSVQRRATDAEVVRAELDLAVRELEDTLREVRQLARGLRPAGLDQGLRAAVQQLVHRSPLPVVVDIDDVELPETVLTTAYFVVAEGVTNALKHAQASRVCVRARAGEDGRLTVEVDDDGRGGATGVADLATLRDRVDALGGTIELRDRLPAGTVLHAVL